MEYVKKRSILFVAILVLSMVLGSISIVSAASRTQDVYKSYDVSVSLEAVHMGILTEISGAQCTRRF